MLSLAETFSNKLVVLCEVHGEVSAPYCIYDTPYITRNPFGPTWTRQNNFLFTHIQNSRKNCNLQKFYSIFYYDATSAIGLNKRVNTLIIYFSISKIALGLITCFLGNFVYTQCLLFVFQIYFPGYYP